MCVNIRLFGFSFFLETGLHVVRASLERAM